MATTNPFDLLGDNDNDDPSLLLAAQVQKVVPMKTLTPVQSNAQQKPAAAKLPGKPLPPAQAVREGKSDGAGRGGRGPGRGFGRGRGSGFSRDSTNNENAFNGISGGYGASEDGDVTKHSGGSRSYGDRPRGAFRGGRRGAFSNGETGEGEHPRRQFERRSGSGRGELKRDGSGRGNWGTPTDEIVPETEEVINEKNTSPEKQPGDEDVTGGNKENTAVEAEEKEPEDKEMTLEEYQKVLEEKRKALQALKMEERKVALDKELESMQQLANKKGNDDIFIKLGSDKDKRKENADKEEKAKKSLSINEFLKPAEGESYYGGRGRGRGGRGFRAGYAGGNSLNVPAPSIEDPGQFPTLGAK
ncbi:RGG repeats nuclear RNA binding protein A-like isoform X2 [Aristolochia californica]|uniref:RGG repeats nuclear RNA binding protein A-like isoform X2 n=1 Tax=Aristolochia californica TaxID=171875 RepID=UPI0035D66A30